MKATSSADARTSMDMPGSRSVAWHGLSGDAVREELQTELQGLGPSQVEERLLAFGRNTLPAPQPPTLLRVVPHQFVSPLIYILLIAGIVAAALSAGVRVIMITGDHPATAFAIARELGIAETPEQVLTGQGIELLIIALGMIETVGIFGMVFGLVILKVAV